MPQIFHRSTNLISRVSIYGAVVIIGALGYARVHDRAVSVVHATRT